MDQPVGNSIEVFDAIVLSNEWGDATAAWHERGIIDTDAPPSLQDLKSIVTILLRSIWSSFFLT